MLESEVCGEHRSPPTQSLKLSNAFNRCFKVISADTPALLEKAYRLRYQVYCQEHNYENPREHPCGQEVDEYDHRSVHSLLLNHAHATTLTAGTVRLILPDQAGIASCFPIQKLTSHPMLRDPGFLRGAAEISRFAVSKEFRRLSLAKPVGKSGHELDPQVVMPFLTLGLIRGMLQMSLDCGVTEWLAVMEPSLLRLLARFSIYFRPIGPPVEYHGLRQPCHISVEALLTRALKEKVHVWEVITDEGRVFQHYAWPAHHC